MCGRKKRTLQGGGKDLEIDHGVIQVDTRPFIGPMLRTLARHTKDRLHLDISLSLGFADRDGLLRQFIEIKGRKRGRDYSERKRETPLPARHQRDELINT